MRRTMLFLLGVLLSSPNSPAAAPPVRRVDFLGDPLPPGAVARFGTTRLRFLESGPWMVFSKDGKEIITGGQGRLRSWSTKDGALTRQFFMPNAMSVYPQLTGKQDRVLGRLRDGNEIGAFDVETGKVLRSVPNPNRGFGPIEISPDGKHLAITDEQGGLSLYEVDNETPARPLKGHPYTINVQAFSPDSRLLATTAPATDPSKSNTPDEVEYVVRVWDVATGKVIREISGFVGGVGQLFWTPDSASLIIRNYKVRVYRVDTGKLVGQSGTDGDSVFGVAVAPRDHLLALSYHSRDGRVEFWDYRNNKLIRTFKGLGGNLATLAFSPDGKLLALPSTDGRSIRLMDTKTGENLPVPPVPRDPFRTFELAPDGKILATSGDDSIVRLFDFRTGKVLRELHGPTGEDLALTFSPNSELIFAMSRGQGYRFHQTGRSASATVWRVRDGKLLWQKSPFVCLRWQFFPDGKTLALDGGNSKQVNGFVDPRTGKELAVAEALQVPYERLAVASDGKVVALVEMDLGPVRLIDLESGKQIGTLPISRMGRMWLEFLPGGRALAVSDRQGFVQLWDVARQREVFQFDAAQSQRHRRRAPIVGMHVLSPDGRLMSMDLDDEAMPRIWEVATGKEVLRLQGRRRMGFKQLQFSPDGKRLLTIDDDRLIHVWDLRELPDVSRPVPGPLSEAELRRLWTLLEQPTADGFRAGLTLSHKPEQAIDLIRRHLHAAPKRDAKRIAELVAQLDSEESADRDRASRELQTLGRVAEPELQAAVDKPLSAEAARRVRGLLAALQHPVAAPAELRAVRAIGVLEWIGSPAALEVLRETANGEPLARETQTAAEALKRLSAK